MRLTNRRAVLADRRIVEKQCGGVQNGRARLRWTPCVEGLEHRCLLATQVAIHEFPVPAVNGSSWSSPFGIVAGPDGAVWFTEQMGNQIGRIDPTTHVLSEFPVPTPTTSGTDSGPYGITVGPDGALWFTEGGHATAENQAAGIEAANQIGRIDPTTHAISDFPVPTPNSFPYQIAAGPDGGLWFTELYGGNIGRIDPTTHAISEFPVPIAGSSRLQGIAAGPDGALWFLIGGQYSPSAIGRIDPTTHAISEFPTPTAESFPTRITLGPDGALWFTEAFGSGIGRIDPTSRAISEVPTPLHLAVSLASGSDGGLWFTEFGGEQIGRIDPATHAISDFPVPTPNSFVNQIAAGPDGALWFTGRNTIGQVVILTPSRTQLLAAPNPTNLGGLATFTAVVSPSAGGAIPTGLVTFTIDGVAQAPVPLRTVNGQAQATYATTTLAAGSHTVLASYAGGGVLAPSASNPVTAVVRAPALAPAPRVAGLARYGIHWDRTRLVLTFSQPMSVATVVSARNYAILTSSRHGHNRVIRVVAATYDAATHRVTLYPVRRLDVHDRYTLLINGHAPSGVRSAASVLLDGAGTGKPGNDYVKRFGPWSLNLPARLRARPVS